MSKQRSVRIRLLSAMLVAALVLQLAVTLTPPRVARAVSVAPLLVLYDPASANAYGRYLQEILTTEGVRDFEVRPLTDLSDALLTGRRAVLLGEGSPSSAQIAALDTFVAGGGGLVAMRPAASLATILGVSPQSGTTAEGYVRITDATQGAGLYGDTMQFHGFADHYALAGASEVARLYSTRTTATTFPAVTIANRGAGKAVMFAYDLARSVVLTRQGNPANADRDIDGDGVIRTIDLFKNWIDLERTSVPQADIQQRLLVRLLQTVIAQPLPRLWYFPTGASTVHIATADAHANPDSYYQTEIDALRQRNATATFYLSPAGNPSASAVASWQSQGFDFGPHPYVDCGYQCGFNDAFTWFQAQYGVNPRTVRTHQVRWSGWTGAASIETQFGVAMDFNFYQWGPWLTNSSGPALGYMSGSGQPMRFIESSGAVLPIYQQHTSLVDEELAPGIGLRGLTLDQALAASRKVIDDSVSGYYTPIATQYHVDYFYPDVSTWGMSTVDYALQQGAVSLHSDAWLTFVQQRAATAVSESDWANNQLSFSVSAGGANQTMLVPVQFGNVSLAGVRVNGATAGYTTKYVNGVPFAMVAVTTGQYVATYTADTTAPTVTGTNPAAGATAVPTTSPISVTFSEVMDRTKTQAAFSLSPIIAGGFSWDVTGTTMTFTPSSALASSTSYTATVSTGATDLAGNALASGMTWLFTTGAVTPPPSVTGVSPISGTVNGGTTVTITGSALTGATKVTFGATAASSYTVDSDTRITAVSPAHPAGTVDVIVTTSVGTSATSSADRFTFVDSSGTLAVTAVNPGTGSTAGGGQVTIGGANFATGASVTFGAASATNVTATSTTSITATVPAGTAGAVDVTVTNPDGQRATLAGGYTYVACPTGCFAQTTARDFGSGAVGTGAYIARTADGEVALAPTVGAEFDGAALPAGWSAAPWATGGAGSVGGGALAVDGALVATSTYYTPGRAVEFVATFHATARYQHAGLGLDLNNSPWAIFSTGSSGGALYARTNGSAGLTDTPISGNWLGAPHRFRIEWTSTGVAFFIDGTQVASHPVAISGELRPVISDGATADGTLVVDWLRLTPYATSGSFTSRVLDSGGDATWGTAAWTGDLPAGTSLAVSGRTGNSPTPDDTWTAFAPWVSGAMVGGTGRYLQYRVDLLTSSSDQTAALRDLTIGFSVSGPLAPTITEVSPTAGGTAGGTAVTIAGTSFAPGATVSFGGIAAANVTVASATSITATTPAHAAGTVDIVVANSDGRSGILVAGYTYLAPAPTVTGLTPTSGSTVGGTSVAISGTGFVGVTGVSFGGTPAASYTVVSETSIRAITPAHAAGKVDVTVRTPAGTSATSPAAEFTYLDLPPAPVVTAVNPGTGSAAGGAKVTITGANFATGVTVSFGGAAATDVTVADATSITATTPARAAGGVDVVVTDANGQRGTLPKGYTYVACPTGCVAQTTVLNFTSGTPGVGAYVARTADGEVALAPTVGAEFDGAALPAGWSAAPWATGGAGTVSGGLLTLDGALASTTSYYTPGRAIEFVATFDRTAPFQHAGLGLDLNGAPWAIFSTGGSGGALYARSNTGAGATDTPISGNWLGAPHRFRIVWTSVTIDYLIDGVPVASHAVGATGDMRPVFSDGAVGGGSLALDWVRLSPHAASGVFTSAVLDSGGAATWGTLAWSGANPAGTGLAIRVRTGDTPAPDASWGAFAPIVNGGSIGTSGRYLQYQIDLTTSDPAQTPALHDLTIGYTRAPAVTAIGPTSGSTAGGVEVTITGTDLAGATAVAFGGVAATAFTVTSGTSITATSPAHAAGTVDVVVTTTGGSSAASTASRFTYITPPPAVAGISPASGSTNGGTVVTVTGSGFTGATGALFGGTAATAFTVVSDTTITATAPAHAAGTVDVTVNSPAGTSAMSAADRFTYVPPPSVTGISPTSGPASGGTSVTVTGANFTGATKVSFGDTNATDFTVTDGTSISATAPTGSGTVDVTVTTTYGVSTPSAATRYTYVPPPSLTAISPTAGPTAGGTTVTLTGTNFASGATVTFGGVAGTAVVVVSETTLTAATPAHAAGAVDVVVTNPDGQRGTLANGYRYAAPPTVTAISPTSGSTAGGTSVTLTGTNFTGATQVTFGTTPATSFTVNSATRITAKSPAQPVAVVDITVTTPGGTSATSPADRFSYIATLVGDTRIENHVDDNPAGMAEAFQYTASASGTVTKLYIYLDRSSAANQVVVGLYGNTPSNNPGTLLSQATIVSPRAGAWNSVAMPPATITANATYWIAVLGPVGSGTVRFRDVNKGGRAQTSVQTTLSSLPTTWTPGTTYQNSPMSAYAVQEPVAAATGVTAQQRPSVAVLSGTRARAVAAVRRRRSRRLPRGCGRS